MKERINHLLSLKYPTRQDMRECMQLQKEYIAELEEKLTSDYAKLPNLHNVVKELEMTGWLHPEYKDTVIEENRYNGVEVVLNAIKNLGNFA